jgi:2,4-dienoyl-CoA reductase-like NADH-dependent reductase (Old Yellow Enzyme family)
MNEATTIVRTPRAPQAPNTDVLFLPYRLGPLNLRHRIVMAPLTLARASRATCQAPLPPATTRSAHPQR